MPELVAISLSGHGKRRWRRYQSYEFARKTSLCGIVLAEIEEVALSLPFGFIHRGERLFPVAILARDHGECLYISAKGHWLGSYVPAMLRAHPFRLKRDQDGRLVLCFDEGSGLLVDSEDEGEPFFEGAEPSETIKQIQAFLETLEASRRATAEACALLQALELVQPWPMADDEDVESLPQPATMPGLLRIDQARFAELDGEALLRLNQSGGLRLALLQTLSERHLVVNQALDKAHEKQRQRSDDEARDYLTEADDDDTLSFAWED